MEKKEKQYKVTPYVRENLDYVQIIRGSSNLFLPNLLVTVLIAFIVLAVMVLGTNYKQETKVIDKLIEDISAYNITYQRVPLSLEDIRKIKKFTINEIDKPNNYITSLLTEEKDVLYVLSKRDNYKPYPHEPTFKQRIEENLYQQKQVWEAYQKGKTYSPKYEKDFVVTKYKLNRNELVYSAKDISDKRDTYFMQTVPFDDSVIKQDTKLTREQFTTLAQKNNHFVFVNEIANLRSLTPKNLNTISFFYGVVYYKYNHVPNAVIFDAVQYAKENHSEIKLTKEFLELNKPTFTNYLFNTGKLGLLLTAITHILVLSIVVQVLHQLTYRYTVDLYFVSTDRDIQKTKLRNLMHYDYFSHSRYLFSSVLWIPLLFGIFLIYIYQPLTVYIEYNNKIYDNIAVGAIAISLIYTMYRESTKIYMVSSKARANLRKTLYSLDKDTFSSLNSYAMENYRKKKKGNEDSDNKEG